MKWAPRAATSNKNRASCMIFKSSRHCPTDSTIVRLYKSATGGAQKREVAVATWMSIAINSRGGCLTTPGLYEPSACSTSSCQSVCATSASDNWSACKRTGNVPTINKSSLSRYCRKSPRASLVPIFRAAPAPLFGPNAGRICLPKLRMISPVPSVDPSSTTIISFSTFCANALSIVARRVSSALKQGIIMLITGAALAFLAQLPNDLSGL